MRKVIKDEVYDIYPSTEKCYNISTKLSSVCIRIGNVKEGSEEWKTGDEIILCDKDKNFENNNLAIQCFNGHKIALVVNSIQLSYNTSFIVSRNVIIKLVYRGNNRWIMDTIQQYVRDEDCEEEI